MTPAHIIEMLQLQDRLNSTINPDWRHAGYPWARAAMVESVELLDHLGWKWWKHQETNLPQAQMELVDIWHFILSDNLVDHKGNIQTATLAIMEGWEAPHRKVYVKDSAGNQTRISELDLRRQIELFGGLAAVNGSLFLPLYRLICEQCELSFMRLCEMYIGKNVLNTFRQNHGYLDGTYAKVWNGTEDNQVLEQIMARPSTVMSFQSLSNELERAYAQVTK
jgi:hypothetical protein